MTTLEASGGCLLGADKCYDQITYVIMPLLLLAVVGSMGAVGAMLRPIQAMKNFQCMA